MTTVRAWAAVHATRPALVILIVVGLASLLFSQSWIVELGPLVLMAPVSSLLLLPAVTGVAVAMAVTNLAQLPLPNPSRAMLARASWAVFWTLIAVGTVNLGQLTGAEADWRSVIRNVLIYVAIGLVTVCLGRGQLAWLPASALTLASMVFGYPAHEPRYYWWAVVMETGVTPTQLVAAAALFWVALLAYTLLRTGEAVQLKKVGDR